jgi:hypothetical protein
VRYKLLAGLFTERAEQSTLLQQSAAALDRCAVRDLLRRSNLVRLQWMTLRTDARPYKINRAPGLRPGGATACEFSASALTQPG